MKDHTVLNRRYEAIAWGALFILIGADLFVPGLLLPYGIATLGIGIILLGLNLARRLSGIPVNGFSVALGLLSLAEGAVSLLRALLGIHINFPAFSIFLIGIGAYIVVRVILKMTAQSITPENT